MPPSRGLWPQSHLLKRLSRSPIAARSSVRQLSSSSLPKPIHSARRIRTASVTPRASYIISQGRANISLWPFSRSESSPSLGREGTPTTTEIPPEVIPAASNAATAPQVATTSPAEIPTTSGITPDESIVFSTPPADVLDPALLDPSIFNKVDHIGQLQELGLQYGWGFTTTVEWIVEHIHVYAGTPWWGTVVLSALAIRVIMAYPFYKASENQARMGPVKPQLDKMQERYRLSSVAGDKMAALEASNEMKLLKQKAGIKILPMVAPLILQMGFGIGAFRLLRAMAAMPVPGMAEGGFGWIMDLTHPDPLYIIPICMTVLLHMMGRMGGEGGANTAAIQLQSAMRPVLLWILPALSFLGTFWLPAAVQLSFAVATSFGIVQNMLLRNETFRRILGMTPLKIKPVPRTSSSVPGKAGAADTSAPPPNPFVNNPFANLKTTSKALRANEYATAIKYQPPAAAETLLAGMPKSKEAEIVASAPKKKKSIVEKVVAEVEVSKGALSKGIKDVTERFAPAATGGNKGDEGRSKAFIQQAQVWEKRKRDEERRAKQKK